MTPEAIERFKTRHRFKPCKTKADLKNWIQGYLKVEMPDVIVDPESNSCPMDMIWEIYNAAIWENDKYMDPSNFEEPNLQFMFYSARAAYKTLGAAILEVLMLCHAKRNIVHLAAIEDQATRCTSYVKKFLSEPYFRDFIEGDNKRTIQMVRYEKKGSGGRDCINKKEWVHLPLAQQELYEVIDLKIEIAICTLAGTNSKHATFMVVDEVDVVNNERAYQEAKHIPDPTNGQAPITVYVSTRKTSVGLVQREIDEARETGLQVRHWNVIDVTAKCPPTRHMPQLPKLSIYTSDLDLKAINKETWEGLTPAEQDRYVPIEGYRGCIENCRMFAVCKGRLADVQIGTSLLLKPIITIQGSFRKFAGDPDMAKAQLMCRKPSSEDLIYPRLDPDLHVLTAAQMAEKITGESFPDNFTREALIKLIIARQIPIKSGMDFGMTHNFSVVTAGIDGNRAFVFDVIEAAELELPQQIAICNQKIKVWNPEVWPDMSGKQPIAAFRKAGFRMRKWNKGPGSVLDGIGVVKMKLRPVMSDEPEIYFLDDPGVLSLVKKLTRYHWKKDAAGRIMDEPAKIDDDSCDAFRYLIMNIFAPKGKTQVGTEEKKSNSPLPAQQQRSPNSSVWFGQVMEYVLGGQETEPPPNEGVIQKKGFVFSM